MSLIIAPENQKLLWNTIRNTQLYKTSIKSQQEGENWFKGIIHIFYNKYKHIDMQLDHIHQINREITQYMINNLKIIYETNNQPIKTVSTIQGTGLTQQTQYVDYNNRESINHSVNNYFERQQEYENMLKTYKPPEIDFAIKLDEPVPNIDEKLKQQIDLRNMEIKNIIPPPSMPAIQNSNMNKLTIQDDIKIPIHTHNIEEKNNVSWKIENKEESIYTTVFQRLNELQDNVSIMSKNISNITSTMDRLEKIILNLHDIKSHENNSIVVFENNLESEKEPEETKI